VYQDFSSFVNIDVMNTRTDAHGAQTSVKRARWWVCFLCAGCILGGAGAVFLNYWDNFHIVVPGLVFRSAQLEGKSLEAYLERYHIRTIVNLRGANPEADWYESERAIASRHRIRHCDIPTDSTTPPTAEEIRQIWGILETKDATPILIHCESGINRTGSLAAICVLLLEDEGALAKARGQLRWEYGNFPWAESTRNNLAYLDRYQKWLADEGLCHSPERFRRWALELGR
jgi:hypothetical protein